MQCCTQAVLNEEEHSLCHLDWCWLVPHQLGSARRTDQSMPVPIDTLNFPPRCGPGTRLLCSFPSLVFPSSPPVFSCTPVLFSCYYKASLAPPLATDHNGKSETQNSVNCAIVATGHQKRLMYCHCNQKMGRVRARSMIFTSELKKKSISIVCFVWRLYAVEE